MSTEATPRLKGAVIGFRHWGLQGYKLTSMMPAGGGWLIGPNTAECRVAHYSTFIYRSRHDEAAPSPHCDCGFYAWHEDYPVRDAFYPASYVLGAVRAWGRIEVHERGFRAQHAEPVLFAYDARQAHEDVARLQAVAGEFGLPVVERAELMAAAAPFGKPVPHELRPEAQAEDPRFGAAIANQRGQYAQYAQYVTQRPSTSRSAYSGPVFHIPVAAPINPGGGEQ